HGASSLFACRLVYRRRGSVAACCAGAATSGAAMKKRGHETTKLKGRNAPPVALHRGPTAADLQKQLDFHTRKLAETQSKFDQPQRAVCESPLSSELQPSCVPDRPEHR